MKKQKIFTLVLISMMILMFQLPMRVLAEETKAENIIANGSCGDETQWILKRDGTLIISGSGGVDDSSSYEQYQDDIKKLEIEDGVTSITSWAFKDFTDLGGTIEFPDSMNVIGYEAFYRCKSITGLKFSDNIKTIEARAFCECENISGQLVLPKNLSKMGIDLFSGCTSITSVKFPDNLTSIPRHMFNGCTGLSGELNLPENITTIGYYAFYNCNKISGNLSIPNSVISIEQNAFDRCSNIKKIQVNNAICEIEDAGDTFDSKIVLSGYRNSTIHEYAKKYNRKFVCIDHLWDDHLICKECGSVSPEHQHVWASQMTIDKKATTSSNGSKSKHCTRCNAKTSVTTIYKASNVKLSTVTYTYNGKMRSPSVVIKDSKGNIIGSANYTLSKPSGRKNVGKYTYKITFKNQYSGTKSLTMKINPKGTSISSLTKASKAFTVKWKKQSAKMASSRITGYQIQYAVNSKFTSPKSKLVSGYGTTSKKITGLKVDTTYYVRVRTYKTVKVDGKSVKLYSGWSTVKSVKTK